MIPFPGLEALALPEPAVLLGRLGRASLAGGLFVAAVWAVNRALPRLPAGLRCALWWAAGLKLLLALVWTVPLELPLLPADRPAAVAPVAAGAADPGTGPAPATGAAVAVGPPNAVLEAPEPFPWHTLLAGLWLAGVAAGAVTLGRELHAARRLRRETAPADPAVAALFDRLRRRLGVRQRVELGLSEGAPGPLTLGLLRPVVVLPARDLARLSRQELEMALSHELLHVRRRDLWAGWVPELARRLFFFHPLAVVAAREYVLAREAACDAGVLRELGAAPHSYGRLLLHWSRPAATPGTATVAGASSTFLDLKRRLVMLQSSSPLSWRLKAVAGGLAVLALAALLPLRIVAQPPEPLEPAAPPEAPDLVAVAAPPASPEPPRTTGTSWSYSDDGAAWALLEPGGHAWMSGSSRDMRRIKRLEASADSPLLWFRRDGREYVTTDPGVLAQAREILEPQRELGRQQGELGARQGELGAEQGELGARQGELGRQQGELGARQGELGARVAALAAEQARLHLRLMDANEAESEELEAREEALEKEMDDLRRQMEELGRQQGALGERQGSLGREQAALGERQAALGEQQAELGRRQEEAARRAEAQLMELFDRAVAQGLAEPAE